MDILKLNTLRGTATAFLTPKRCDEHPFLLYGSRPSGCATNYVCVYVYVYLCLRLCSLLRIISTATSVNVAIGSNFSSTYMHRYVIGLKKPAHFAIKSEI